MLVWLSISSVSESMLVASCGELKALGGTCKQKSSHSRAFKLVEGKKKIKSADEDGQWKHAVIVIPSTANGKGGWRWWVERGTHDRVKV